MLYVSIFILCFRQFSETALEIVYCFDKSIFFSYFIGAQSFNVLNECFTAFSAAPVIHVACASFASKDIFVTITFSYYFTNLYFVGWFLCGKKGIVNSATALWAEVWFLDYFHFFFLFPASSIISIASTTLMDMASPFAFTIMTVGHGTWIRSRAVWRYRLPKGRLTLSSA